LPLPTEEGLNSIAVEHFGQDAEKMEVYSRLAEKTIELQKQSAGQPFRPPSTAEFLDAVRATLQLNISIGSKDWDAMIRATLSKSEAAIPAR
jgi:hypothetical protein